MSRSEVRSSNLSQWKIKTFTWQLKRRGCEAQAHSQTAHVHSASRPRTCRGLTRHFHIGWIVFMREGAREAARAQLGLARWTDWRRPRRYLRLGPTCPRGPPPSGTGWCSKTKRPTKDVPRMFTPADRIPYRRGSAPRAWRPRSRSGTPYLFTFAAPDSRSPKKHSPSCCYRWWTVCRPNNNNSSLRDDLVKKILNDSVYVEAAVFVKQINVVGDVTSIQVMMSTLWRRTWDSN